MATGRSKSARRRRRSGGLCNTGETHGTAFRAAAYVAGAYVAEAYVAAKICAGRVNDAERIAYDALLMDDAQEGGNPGHLLPKLRSDTRPRPNPHLVSFQTKEGMPALWQRVDMDRCTEGWLRSGLVLQQQSTLRAGGVDGRALSLVLQQMRRERLLQRLFLEPSELGRRGEGGSVGGGCGAVRGTSVAAARSGLELGETDCGTEGCCSRPGCGSSTGLGPGGGRAGSGRSEVPQPPQRTGLAAERAESHRCGGGRGRGGRGEAGRCR
mmetsp:Transcript_49572/g.112904  ORF Transcript_49572/g.112904 Transcript_49572/m.112904 type:complete len:268 (+) Transcript_49572:367-1170(+)